MPELARRAALFGAIFLILSLVDRTVGNPIVAAIVGVVTGAVATWVIRIRSRLLTRRRGREDGTTRARHRRSPGNGIASCHGRGHAYAMTGSTVTTYVQGPAGLIVTDVAGTPTYPVTNLHGDVVGTTNAAGGCTANPTPDEFGVGGAASGRLGWLGSKERFSDGTANGLIRMGVRLYDPRLGRFLEVVPVEGGSSNDYDYVSGDPINGLDLDGTCAQFWQRRCRGKGSWWRKSGGVARNPIVQTVVGTAACTTAAVACVGAGLVFAGLNASSNCADGMTSRCAKGLIADGIGTAVRTRATRAFAPRGAYDVLPRASRVLARDVAYNARNLAGYGLLRALVGRQFGGF